MNRRGAPRGDYEARYPLAEKLAALSEPDPFGGCLLWTGALNDGGYGRVKVRGRFRRAHIVAFEIANGPVPDGLRLDHLCRVRSCINARHLEPVTSGENTRRGVIARSRLGHPFPWTIKHGRKCKRC